MARIGIWVLQGLGEHATRETDRGSICCKDLRRLQVFDLRRMRASFRRENWIISMASWGQWAEGMCSPSCFQTPLDLQSRSSGERRSPTPARSPDVWRRGGQQRQSEIKESPISWAAPFFLPASQTMDKPT